MEQPPHGPVFVACGARSGSTLLRLLLDRHPALSCPAETDVAVLVQSYLTVAISLLGRPAEEAARHRARAMADGLMTEHLAAVGKRRWCDKSLSNAFHLDLLADLWPEAGFVLLHRHAMDMVASGLEASPWGLSEYGFAQVAQRSPTDSVVALAAYWADRTARMLDFEDRRPQRCLRIRYEDLVSRPAEVLDALWAHLGVEPPEEGVAGAFATASLTGSGPADHTIWYTDRVHRRAVGRGARIPADRVAGPLRDHLNALLGRLAYAPVDDAWGSGGGLEALLAQPGSSGPPPTIELRLVEGHRLVLRRTVALDGRTGAPGATTAAAQQPGAVVALERGALAGVATGRENLGSALRSRHIRYYGPALQGFDDERQVFDGVRRYLAETLDELVAEMDEAGEPDR